MNPESTGPGESRVSANRFCSNCGAERQAQANFCSSCEIPFTPSDGNNSSGGPDVSGAEVGEASRRLLWIAIATALVLGGLVVCGADWWIRNQELNSLVTRIEASERVLTDFNTSLDSAQSRVMTDLTSFGPEQAKKNFNSTVLDYCSKSAIPAIATGAEVAGTAILPRHTGIREAQDSYLKHSNAWKIYLESCAAGPYEPPQSNHDINGTWETLKPVLEAALPWPSARYNLQTRVDQLLLVN
jgi:hypothetical protein